MDQAQRFEQAIRETISGQTGDLQKILEELSDLSEDPKTALGEILEIHQATRAKAMELAGRSGITTAYANVDRRCHPTNPFHSISRLAQYERGVRRQFITTAPNTITLATIGQITGLLGLGTRETREEEIRIARKIRPDGEPGNITFDIKRQAMNIPLIGSPKEFSLSANDLDPTQPISEDQVKITPDSDRHQHVEQGGVRYTQWQNSRIVGPNRLIRVPQISRFTLKNFLRDFKEMMQQALKNIEKQNVYE